MPNYIKLGNLRIEIPEPANNGGGGGGGGSSSLLTGLLAFYNLSDLTDASGNGNTLTNNNGVTFSAGKVGNAMNCNGGSSWLSTDLGTTSQFTASLWISLPTNGTDQHFISNWNLGNNSFFMARGGNGALYGAINSSIFNWDGNNTPISDQTYPWIHFVFAYDGSNVKVYTHGQNTNTVASGGSVNLSTLNIGRLSGVGGPTGQLDAVGIWSRALTSGEVTELYNAGTGKEHPFA